MLKKLQHKFMLLNMSLIGFILLGVFIAIGVYSYSHMRSELNSSLRSVVSDDSPDKKNPNQQQKSIITDFNITVTKHDSHIIIEENNSNLSESEIREIGKSAMGKGSTSGTLSSAGYYYYKSETVDSTRIVFVATSYFKDSMIQLVILLVGIYAVSMVAIGGISLFLSKQAISPIAKVWKAQQQFVADASHELKTPLTVILANTGLLLSHPQSTIEVEKKWVENTQDEATHMKHLIEQLLYLAQTEANGTKTAFSTLNLSQLATRCILQFEAVAYEASITFNYTVSEPLMLKGDETQLTQLFLILIDNALKYVNANGKISVTVVEHHGKIQIKVFNTGPLIDPEDLPHVFDRFYRGDKSRTSNGSSSYGLGLSIAKQIITAHHGTITVQSNASLNGTLFTVCF